MAGRRITVQFIGEDKSVGSTANQVEGRMSRMGGKLATVGKVAALGFAAVGAGAVIMGKQVLSSASDAQQSIGATETVFGKFSKAVIDNSNKAATAVGLSANAYRENANLIGSLFKNQGVSSDQLAAKTDKMIKVGADLAATFGGSTKDSVEALGSAFKGEFDPLERYGISLKQSTVNAEAMRVAHVKSQTEFNKLTLAQQTAAKQQATSNLIMKQSADSAGQFSRESDTLAGAQQRLGAKFENIKATLGEKLLPVATKVVTWVSDLTDKFKSGEGAGAVFQKVFQKIGEVITPIGNWIKNEFVPTIKDLVKRFWDAIGGTKGLHDIFRNLQPAITVVKATLGVLWAGLKIAAKVAIPLIVAQIKIWAATIGAIGRLAIWLWNKAFQPTIKFILQGIGWVIDKIGDMLGVLGHIKGFGWAKDAADKLHEAARQADKFSKAIKDIPSSKEIKIKVKYSGNNGIGGSDKGSYDLTGKKGHRAMGGPVTAGMPYIVGERRPELFVPSQNGRIVPRVPSSSGGDFTVTAPLVLKLDSGVVWKGLLKVKRDRGGVSLGLA